MNWPIWGAFTSGIVVGILIAFMIAMLWLDSDD